MGRVGGAPETRPRKETGTVKRGSSDESTKRPEEV